MAKYNPCPVCGGKTLLKHYILTRRWFEKKFFIECDYCHFCAKAAYTERGAIKKWNNATNVVRMEDAHG